MPRIRIARLEQRIDERRDHGALGENHEAAKHHHHDQDRQQPEFLPDAHKPPKLGNKIHLYSFRTDLASSRVTDPAAAARSSSCPRPAAASTATGPCPSGA